MRATRASGSGNDVRKSGRIGAVPARTLEYREVLKLQLRASQIVERRPHLSFVYLRNVNIFMIDCPAP